jgi:hypothetical protein
MEEKHVDGDLSSGARAMSGLEWSVAQVDPTHMSGRVKHRAGRKRWRRPSLFTLQMRS